MNNLRDEKERMIQLFITGVRVGLIAAAITATFSMITFAQTTKPTIENTPTATREEVTSDSLKSDKKSTDRDTSVQTEWPAGPAISAAVKVEIQRHVNNLRREQLDDRASYIDYWLAAVAIVLTFFGIVIALAGYIGFGRFREIETEGKENVTASAEQVEDAKRLVDEIKSIRDESAEILQDMNAEDVAEAPEEAKQAAANVAENPMASLIDKAIIQAVFLQQENKRDEAIEKWRAIARVAAGIDNDQAARAWFSVGYLLDNSEESISAYDRAISLKSDFVEAYNNRGIAKADLERYEEAIADFDEAIRLKPDYVEAYYNRGIAKVKLERYEEAIADFDEAIRLKPGYAEAYNNRGIAKVDLERYEEAISDYDEATHLQPDYAEAYYNRGIVKADLERYEEAISDYDEATHLQPDYAEAYHNRSIAKAALGQLDEAISDYNEAIRLKPDLVEAYYNRGIAKGQLGHHEDAITDFDEAIRLNPDYADTYINRGIAKGSLDRIDEARQDFEKARDLARDAGNDSAADAAEQLLRNLDNQEDE